MGYEMQLKLVTDSEFRSAAKEEKAENLGILKGSTDIRSINTKKRTIDFIISTESIDRVGDRIFADGWDLTAYKKNPVVLFAHDKYSPPIAKACNTRRRRDDKQLVSTAEFMPADLNPFAETIFRMYVERYMKATSVGFVPLKWHWASENDEEEKEKNPNRNPYGIDFEKQELLEYSCVPVPANSEALIDARSKGIDTMPIKTWAEQVLDEWDEHEGLILPKVVVQSMCRDADAAQKKFFRLSSDKKRELRKENLKRLQEQSSGSHASGEDIDMVDRGAISYAAAHASGTPKAGKDSSWDGPGEVAKAEISDLKIMCTWKASGKSDADLTKGDFKLPHHKASGHAVVWRGVANAAARLPQTNVSEADKGGIRTHLGKHYAQFDEEPPWKSAPDEWAKYEKLAAIPEDKRGEEQVKDYIDLYEKLFPMLVEEVGEGDLEIDWDTITDESETDVDDTDNGTEESEEIEDTEVETDLDDEIKEEFEDSMTLEDIFSKLLEYTDLVVDSIVVGDETKAILHDYAITRSGKRNIINLIDGLRDAADVLELEFNLKQIAEVEEKEELETVTEPKEEKDDVTIDFEDIDIEDKEPSEDELMGLIQEVLPDVVRELLGSEMKKFTGKVD